MTDINEQKQMILQKLREAASSNPAVAFAASRELATALSLPLRKAVLSGSTIDGIFEELDFRTNPNVEFPLDLLAPGDEGDHYAYTIPGEGLIPYRNVEADYLRIPTYSLGNAIDCNLRFLRDANWPVVNRMIEVLEMGFAKKLSDDGWQTIIFAGTDRNLIVTDNNAAAGQFTPRLIALMANTMRRGGGGNSGSMNRAKLTDVYMSPEAHFDMRDWDLSQVSDNVRTNIYYSPDDGGDLAVVYGVKVHTLDELGEGQDYQTYYGTTLGGGMGTNDTEIVIGLDLNANDSFVHPIREDVQITEDNTLHRQNRFGLYGRTEIGFGVLDSRRVLLGSL